MASVRIIDPKTEDRRYYATVTTLFSVGIMGLCYLVYDYVHVMNHVSLPQSSVQIDPVVEELQQGGLVKGFDVNRAELVVAEDDWNSKPRAEKAGIIARLGRYCAEKHQTDTWSLKVVGSNSMAVLGGIDQRGMHVN